MTVEQFAREYWCRKPTVFIGVASRFESLHFDFEELRGALRTRPATTTLKARFVDGSGATRRLSIGLPQLDLCFDAGMAIEVSNVSALLPRLGVAGHALAETGGLLGGEFSFACHRLPPGADTPQFRQDAGAFVCVVGGRQRWQFTVEKEGAPSITVGDREEGVVLEKGDVLYLPAGALCRAVAGSEGSVSLVLGVSKGHAKELLDRCLNGWLAEHEAWLRPLPLLEPGEPHAKRLPAAVEEALAERLAELKAYVGALSLEKFADGWPTAGR